MVRDGVKTYGEIQSEALGDNAVLNNLALVKRIALHLKARVPDVIELDDMIQVGTIGLMEAVKSFRSDEGVEFDFFAKTRIKGSILVQSFYGLIDLFSQLFELLRQELVLH